MLCEKQSASCPFPTGITIKLRVPPTLHNYMVSSNYSYSITIMIIKRETESLLKVAQNNAIRTNHIKVKIDDTQQINKLCIESDETVDYIKRE